MLVGVVSGIIRRMRALRFGLVGTGYWARIAHAPALGSAEGIEFAAVWGRDFQAATALAGGYGATAHEDFAEFLAAVDAVAFAVPPDVQGSLAVRAAQAGKHLMLEKPIAVTVGEADALAEAVERAGVASAVFFTSLYQAGVRRWLAEVETAGDWAGASAVWLGSALMADNPFNTPWRQAKGGLWDLGPHLVALLWNALGPVTSVTADRGAGDVTHLVLHHRGGPSSVVTVGMDMPEANQFFELFLWGPSGRSAAPREAGDPVPPLRTALTELAAGARSGQLTHPCDVRLGRDVVHVLAEAAGQLGR
jgi:predicted dehydrogenase